MSVTQEENSLLRTPSKSGAATAMPATAQTYVVFDLFGQTLGVDVRCVREILAIQEISQLPNAPTHVSGVIDVRGQCVPIVDLSSAFGMMPGGPGEEQRIVVFEVNSPTGTQQLGVIAERVQDVAAIDAAEIERVETVNGGAIRVDGVMGASRREGQLIFLIDIEYFISRNVAWT